MAANDYTRGEMDINAQSSMYKGFMTAGMWGTLITLMIVGYATFTLSIGMNWMVALVLCAGGGIGAGLFLGFGGAWIASVIALSGLAVVVQVLIMVAKALL